MNDNAGRITRTQMSNNERAMRSRINQLVSEFGLLRGSLLVRKRLCGHAGCRCRTKGERHESLALQVSIEGRSRQFHVPKAMREEVRAWVENYQEVRALLDQVSEIYLDKMSKKKTRD